MSKQCRLCAKFTESSIDLFLEHERTLLTKINSFLPITITNDRELPLKICCKCVERCNATHSFIQEILLAQEVFGISNGNDNSAPTNSVMYGGVTISSANHAAINVPTASVKKHKKPQNVSETLKKLKKMQTGNLTISKTLIQGPKPVRRCKVEPKFYGEDEDENDFEFDSKDNDEDEDPNFDGFDASDDSVSINNDENDEDYEPSGKKRKATSNHSPKCTDKKLPQTHATDSSQKFQAIKINAPPVFLCMKCKNRFESLAELKQHVFQKNCCTIDQLTCKVCSKTFDNKKRMSQHMKTHEEKSKFICDKCGKMYTNQFNLENHKSSQHGEYLDEFQNVFKCRLCNEKFNNRTDLYAHMKAHAADTQPLLCDTCGKCFTSNHNLRTHIRNTHMNIRPHECALCPKRFRTRLLLKQHLHVHTGIKEFQCSLCDQSFAKRDSLRIHLRKRHPDNKPSPTKGTNETEILSNAIVTSMPAASNGGASMTKTEIEHSD